MARRRPSKSYVFNATGRPFVFDAAGHSITPGQTRQADPEDPVTARYLAKGDLILKEG